MNPLYSPVIETRRTFLIVLHPNYVDLYLEYQLNNIDHLARWEPDRNDDFFKRESALARTEAAHTDFLEDTALKFIAIDRVTRKMVGLCFFTTIQKEPLLGCNLGYSVSKECEGTGLMREIVSAGIRYMFDEFGLHRITACYMPVNLRSATLLAGLGFEIEGYAKSYLKIAGQWEDMVICSRINPKI